MIAVVDPRQADAVMVGEGDAPVVAVLRVVWKRPTSASLPPKGANRGPPDLFPCKLGASWGCTKGAMMPFMAPFGGRAVGSATELSGCRTRGRRTCPPLWQYLKQTTHGTRAHHCTQRLRSSRLGTQLIPVLDAVPAVGGTVGPAAETARERARRPRLHQAFLALACCLVCFRRLQHSL
jgi:hypothetical protein